VTLTPGRKPVGPVTADVTHDLLLDSIAWYPLLGRTSKDVPDLLFRKEHGNLVGGVEYVRDYLEFDGSTGYVDFGNSDILTGATEVSFLTRVRFHTLTTNANIYRKNAAGQNSFAFGLDNINSDELTFGVIDPSNNWLIADTTDVNLTTGVWYDIAFVWEGGNNSFIIVNGTDATISNQLADNPSAIKGSTERNTFGCKYNAGAPDSFCHMDMAFSLVSTKALTKEHALRFFANPYAALASAHRPLIFSGAGGGVTLTIADVLHGHLVENLSLTQAHALAVQESSHGHTADNLDLVQLYTLTVQEASHAHAADNLDLTQAHALAVQEAGHAHAADSVVLETAGTLSVADALHGHTADNLDLTQAHLLAIADAAHAHAADNIDLSTGIPLVVADASHGHAADNVALTQAHVLAIAEAVHGHLADNIDLTVTHAVLIVSDALHAHLADNINLTIPGQSVDTPIGRIYLVQAENRVVAVAAENRTLIVQ